MTEQSWIFIIGIIVAVAAYLSKNFIFEQLLVFRKVRGRIQNRLKYHSNIITNGELDPEFVRPIRDELRQLNCDLEESYFAIPFHNLVWWAFRIPKPRSLNEAAEQLIFLSNSTGSSDSIEANHESIELIRKHLALK